MQSFIQYRAIGKRLQAEKKKDEDQPTEPDSRKAVQTLNRRTELEVRLERKCTGDIDINRSLQSSTHTLHSDMIPPSEIERADFDVPLEDPISRRSTRVEDDHRSSLTVTGVQLSKDDKSFVVSFESEDDPMDPHNWGPYRRALYTFFIVFMATSVEFATIADSTALERAASGQEGDPIPKYLVIGAYIIGLGLGALVSGPFSEVFGRNPVYMFSLTLFNIMVISNNFVPLRGYRDLTRGIAGLMGSGTSVTSAGAMSDLWPRLERAYIFAIYTCVVFAGPLLASLIGPILVEKYHRLMFPAHITFGSLGWAVGLFLLPETYGPIILYWKAKQLRKLTNDPRFKAPIELKTVSFKRRMLHALYRPFLFFFRDGMLAMVTMYTALNYVVTYQMFSAIPLTATTVYHLNLIKQGLFFIPTIGGVFLCAPVVYHNYKRMRKKLRSALEKGQTEVEPEVGLYLAMVGAPAIPVSLFWYAWTATSSISYLSPLFATALFTYGVICVTISVFQYVTDSFEYYAASAQATVLMVRYVAAGIMAEFSVLIYKKLHIHGALTLFGILSSFMVPIPFLLYRYGYRIRRGKYIRHAKRGG